MEKLSLKELAVPIIKAIDSFNYLLKSHHRRTAVIAYHIARKLNMGSDDIFRLVISAALHDIGALSIQERDALVQEDVQNPEPHCKMGHTMLSSFDAFKDVSQIIKHHHIHYIDSLNNTDDEILFESHVLHLADRVDILINPNEFILKQKNTVLEKIREKVGTTFHPLAFKGLVDASIPDIFWIEIDSLELDHLFRRVNSSMDFYLTIDNVLDFALTMSRIIDFRSHFTASHSYTVAHVAEQIGEICNFSKERCMKLKISGYLHDIGKIGVAPGLIEKGGPLTNDEFSMVKLHTYYTGQILNDLSTSDWFNEIVRWAQNHHEKNDGSGYPYSISEDMLDDGCKIIAFSDIIAALMENRPYRESLPVDTAFNIIKNSFASRISLSMFTTIEEHKNLIDAVVLQCQKNILEDYNQASTTRHSIALR